jgi:replicative DNA helicase
MYTPPEPPEWATASPQDAGILPADKEAEAAVLGSALIDPDAAARLSTLVDADDFYYHAHATIYGAMVTMSQAGTPPTDFLLLCDELERMGKLEEVGGHFGITTLMGVVPTAIHFDHYAAMVKRLSAARRMIAGGAKIVEAGYDKKLTLPERMAALEEIQRKFFTISEVSDSVLTWERSINEQIPRMEEQAAALKNKVGFDWPYARWNEILGEFPAGLTMQILGDDGTGKTQLVDILGEWWTKMRGKRGLYISTDMSRDMTESRRLTRHSGLLKDQQNPQTMSDEQWDRLMATQNDLLQWEGKINYVFDPEIDIDQVCRLIEAEKRAGMVDYVILDNLNNFLDFPSQRQIKLGMNENQRGADNASRFIARIAKCNLRGIAINQLTKSGKNITSIDDVSKQDAYGSGRQSNKIRLNINLFRGYAEKDEISPDGEILCRKGERSRYLHYKWTKVTNGSEFKGVLLMTPQLYRMNEVIMRSENLN